MCENTWFGGGSRGRCINPRDNSRSLSVRRILEGFRILNGDLLKKLMNKGQNICAVFEKINPRGTREIIDNMQS